MNNAVKNTAKEIWRAVIGDFYSPSIHVTEAGNIGINVGGRVFVLPIREWHDMAKDKYGQKVLPKEQEYKPTPKLPEKLIHETRWDMDKCIVAKINALIDYLTERGR